MMWSSQFYRFEVSATIIPQYPESSLLAYRRVALPHMIWRAATKTFLFLLRLMIMMVVVVVVSRLLLAGHITPISMRSTMKMIIWAQYAIIGAQSVALQMIARRFLMIMEEQGSSSSAAATPTTTATSRSMTSSSTTTSSLLVAGHKKWYNARDHTNTKKTLAIQM